MAVRIQDPNPQPPFQKWRFGLIQDHTEIAARIQDPNPQSPLIPEMAVRIQDPIPIRKPHFWFVLYGRKNYRAPEFERTLIAVEIP
jgi:hypothetical protein